MRAFLERVPAGVYRAEDFLDGDGVTDRAVKIAVTITVGRKQRSGGSGGLHPIVTVDFGGSDPQVEGSINAVEAITFSACFYVFRCLLAEDVPATAGLMRLIHTIAPEGTIGNARPPAAVAGGEGETAQPNGRGFLPAAAATGPPPISA